MPHLVVSITGHGYGHVAQTAPVLNALHHLHPQLRLTVRSAVPTAHLRSRIHAPFDHLPSQGDIGMVMSSALDVRTEDSRKAYRDFHADWVARIEDEVNLLQRLQADAVFSNVGYLPLVAAQRLGIPNLALCSLNWHDIYQHYCGHDDIASQIGDAYTHADTFLRTTPGMPMGYLSNLKTIAPIASIGTKQRDELNRHLHLSAEQRLVLVSLGGIASRLPMERWPRIDGVRWLVQTNWQVQHPDVIALESLPFSFEDLLASSDALLCKPGYGSFVEATCSNIPVLFVSRTDWPESPALIDWLQEHGRCREVSRDTLERGDIARDLHALWAMPPRQQVVAAGASEAANHIMQLLARSGA